MVMEKEYGREQMKRFLEFELDNYLRGRGGEIIGEQPLYLVENQPDIHYRKGGVVMYALQDYIGEGKVNEALAEFIDTYAFKGAPYPTSKDLVKLLRQKAQPEHQSTMTFKIRVAEKPFSVGIDPLNKLIDRKPEDNVKTL
ncbi:MAG: hypothetical protein ACKVKL_16160 [Pseudomonadales bacterium]|jgi:ABC-2 type transport system permease protein|tara:strand:+ start:17478 stop:17900 length:423 start_codon:yes stop_codon:yes gene_type:complete